jgi:hypothetical protein
MGYGCAKTVVALPTHRAIMSVASFQHRIRSNIERVQCAICLYVEQGPRCKLPGYLSHFFDQILPRKLCLIDIFTYRCISCHQKFSDRFIPGMVAVVLGFFDLYGSHDLWAARMFLQFSLYVRSTRSVHQGIVIDIETPIIDQPR